MAVPRPVLLALLGLALIASVFLVTRSGSNESVSGPARAGAKPFAAPTAARPVHAPTPAPRKAAPSAPKRHAAPGASWRLEPSKADAHLTTDSARLRRDEPPSLH